jgi:hypothetical protein
MLGKEAVVSGQATQVVASALDAIADNSARAVSSVQALGRSSHANTQATTTLGANMQVINDQRHALGTVLQNQGAVLESAGDSLITAGARMETAGTEVDDASADLLESSGVHMENAAIFFEGH